jgi:hypothetical protein
VLALRLTRAARPAVQLRRLLVAAASAGTGFLLLSCLGYALNHPEAAGAGALRLGWCAVPVAATVYFALAVARTDPGARPRPGLSAIGLGPARLMAMSALTTALSSALGSLLALLLFLRLRRNPAGLPFGGAAADFLAAGKPLPLPAAVTLLALLPALATVTVTLALRPRDPRPAASNSPRRCGRFGAYGTSLARETFGAYGRFGARFGHRPTDGAPPAPDTAPDPEPLDPAPATDAALAAPDPGDAPTGLPWGIALLAAGLAVPAYAGEDASAPSLTTFSGQAVAVLLGWVLTAVGLVVAAPGLTHLCGRLLQAVRPGALRLLAGRVLMAEATRIGRPLGVLCAVAAAGYAMTALYDAPAPSFGPLRTLGALVVVGCTAATLLTAAVETRQCRAHTTAALLRLGAPAMMLRTAAALRAAALLALFGPLTLAIATLAALPLAH